MHTLQLTRSFKDHLFHVELPFNLLYRVTPLDRQLTLYQY